jgi:antitoxin HicB
MQREYTFTIEVHPGEEGDSGYWVSVPALPGCFSRSETYEEAISNAREAIELHLKGFLERGEPIPVEPQQLPVTTHIRLIRVNLRNLWTDLCSALSACSADPPWRRVNLFRCARGVIGWWGGAQVAHKIDQPVNV